eukprot:TRINITY_DN286_c0_g2_i1.p3 TRINITY_DN286_c0_g2~~TRINITY_DN286_c0_g2_i1.p3  ORF type:complete len:94 (+),score=20.45 TRINITY_DN286_c0_g2_i1:933-1214(+)
MSQNSMDIPKSNTFWTPPPSRNGQSHQTEPFSSSSLQTQEQESLVYPFEKRQNLSDMNEVDVTRDVHYISNKKRKKYRTDVAARLRLTKAHRG